MTGSAPSSSSIAAGSSSATIPPTSSDSSLNLLSSFDPVTYGARSANSLIDHNYPCSIEDTATGTTSTQSKEDLSEGTIAITKSTSCSVHTLVTGYINMLLEEFPYTLRSAGCGQPTNVLNVRLGAPGTKAASGAATETLTFFSQKLVTDRSKAGAAVYQTVNFHLLMKVKKVFKKRRVPDENLVIQFETLSKERLEGLSIPGNEHYDPSLFRKIPAAHFLAVRNARELSTGHDVPLAGFITCTETPFATTQVVLEAQMVAQPDPVAAILGGGRMKESIRTSMKHLKDMRHHTDSRSARSRAGSGRSAHTSSSSLSTSFGFLPRATSTRGGSTGVGDMPYKLEAASILTHLCSCVLDLHEHFARYAAVEAAEQRHFIDVTLASELLPMSYTEEEMVKTSMHFCEKKWARQSNTLDVECEYFHHLEAGEAAWAKGRAKVDASAANATSWLWHSMTKARIDAHRSGNGNLMRKEVKIPLSHSKMFVNGLHLSYGFDDRIFAIWMVWKRHKTGEITISFADMETNADAVDLVDALNEQIAGDKHSCKAIRGGMKGIYSLKPLAPNVCEVSIIAQGNLAGSIPEWLLNSNVLKGLHILDDVGVFFQRNGRVVDAEERAAFAPPPFLRELAPDQRALIERCLQLNDSSSSIGRASSMIQRFSSVIGVTEETLWEEMRTKCLVKMYKRFTKPAKGERRIALGKAECFVDCDAKNALSWAHAFCSRERNRTNVTERHSSNARLIIENSSPIDHKWAMIKDTPFFLSDREFVGRSICARNERGHYIQGAESIPDVVDYGGRKNFLRGTTRWLYVVEPEPTSHAHSFQRCKVSFYVKVDPGGMIPIWFMNKRAHASLLVLDELRKEFEHDAEMDGFERNNYAAVISSKEQEYSTDELADFQTTRDRFRTFSAEEGYNSLQSPDHLLTMDVKETSASDGAGVMTATTICDDTPAVLAASELGKLSRHNTAKFIKSSGISRYFSQINEHHFLYHLVKELNIPGLKPREFLTRALWKWADADTLVVAYLSCEDTLYPRTHAYVRAEANAMWIYERLPPKGGKHEVPQTRVTYWQSISLGGAIPMWVITKQGVSQLMHLSYMRQSFDRGAEIDRSNRNEFLRAISARQQTFSSEDDQAIEEGLGFFERFDSMRAKSIRTATPLAVARVAKTGHTATAWGMSSTNVRASAKDVLAYVWDSNSQNHRHQDDVVKATDAMFNEHSKILYWRKSAPKPLFDREFISKAVWKPTEKGCYLVVTIDAVSAIRPRMPDVVRGKFLSAIRLTAIDDQTTKIDYVIHPDNLGRIPAWLTSKNVVSNLEYVSEIQESFLADRDGEDYDVTDGEALGFLLMKGGKRDAHKRVGKHVKNVKALAMLAAKYRWFELMLTEIVKGQLALNRSVSTKLECVSDLEARKIGDSLCTNLRARKTAEAGLYQWAHQNPCIEELFDKHEWVEAMLLTVSGEILKSAPWGLVWRVCVGAGLSMLDMGTDIDVILLYRSSPETELYSRMLLGFVCSMLAMQLAMTWANHRNDPRRLGLIKELLFVIFGMKPAADAYRVAAGAEQQAHHVLDAKTEQIFNKSIEMFTESVPGCLLQCYALGRQLERNPDSLLLSRALSSLIISALTTGFTSASISYDYDTNPTERKSQPEFYGYVPNKASSRSIMFFMMMLNSSLLLLVRCSSAALLMLININYFIILTLVDVGLYTVYKLCRRDFYYWLPIHGVLGVVMSAVCRLVCKVLADYSGVLQLRHPGEIGGLYFSCNIVIAFLSSGGAFAVYANMRDEESKLDLSLVGLCVGGCVGLWLVTFAVMLLFMKGKYRKSFFSTMTGAQMTCNYFTANTDEAIKSLVFLCNNNQWKRIRPDVKTWIAENWFRWEETNPAFFTEMFKSSVPTDMIPSAEVRLRMKLGGAKRRRSSVGLLGSGADAFKRLQEDMLRAGRLQLDSFAHIEDIEEEDTDARGDTAEREGGWGYSSYGSEREEAAASGASGASGRASASGMAIGREGRRATGEGEKRRHSSRREHRGTRQSKYDYSTGLEMMRRESEAEADKKKEEKKDLKRRLAVYKLIEHEQV